MKKVFCLLLAVMLLLCACGKQPQKAAKSDEQILQERRETAEAHMRYMMSVLWQPDTDIVYSSDVSSMGVSLDAEEDVLRLYADRVYSGMPYTHGSGAGETFLSYGTPDEKGVYQITGLTTELISGGGGTKPNNTARLSNDCADAVSWAWARVGNSFSFTLTGNMTAARGCLPVGNYKTAESTYKKTRELCKENGEEVMFGCYAILQMADAVVTYNGTGHAMMIAENHPVRTNNGIDPEESYVLVHEQFTGNARQEVTRVDEETGLTVYCLGGVDRKYTYSQLFKKGYLPITIKELVNPDPVPAIDIVDSAKKLDGSTITSGTLSSLHKIASVTVRITDASGTVLQEATCFTMEAEHYMFRMANFTEPLEQPVMKGALAPEELAPGSYRCVTQCLMGTGETVTVRDFTFTVE